VPDPVAAARALAVGEPGHVAAIKAMLRG
jgi:hypothetical protein